VTDTEHSLESASCGRKFLSEATQAVASARPSQLLLRDYFASDAAPAPLDANTEDPFHHQQEYDGVHGDPEGRIHKQQVATIQTKSGPGTDRFYQTRRGQEKEQHRQGIRGASHRVVHVLRKDSRGGADIEDIQGQGFETTSRHGRTHSPNDHIVPLRKPLHVAQPSQHSDDFLVLAVFECRPELPSRKVMRQTRTSLGPAANPILEAAVSHDVFAVEEADRATIGIGVRLAADGANVALADGYFDVVRVDKVRQED
jgi:hypothetical protein